mmetsp:Transcript_13958/g.24471  ORF Transcript_13958/g.24471 Transcript_13958/m.24471 type:complete len:262 (+) Transcript_13958:99-884(+)|eukprot:CAMPEP_0119106290 /NCGR_PEP_ID=MMETSP1180-20130426/4024_1 /TAXON_ID=3052 ORGANISM="Chlamydomonas cf sp, Strain CCMP681" /NCGR_SAMPLE_ID=MMETSP1180 /ASSEMBLY_ACC=CAM_ASM_000741 /LENGTH=261 /DNA_ID=CAMNT_0007091591 /DNA_START=17 /DNA_END=802 /DNA_ORIENTATION=+
MAADRGCHQATGQIGRQFAQPSLNKIAQALPQLWKPHQSWSLRPFGGGATGRPRMMRGHLPLASLGLPNADPPHPVAATPSAKPTLNGRWVKDKSLSDNMSPVMDVMKLGGVVRQAVKLVRGLSINQDSTTWEMSVVSVLSWFKVTERYPLDGGLASFKRRDLRRGQHQGCLLQQPGPHGGLQLSLTWPEPLGGTGVDEFVLAPRGTARAGLEPAEKKDNTSSSSDAPHLHSDDSHELHVHSSLEVAGQRYGYRTVYHRKQ